MSYANSVDPDQTPRYAASDLCLHCLPLMFKICLKLELKPIPFQLTFDKIKRLVMFGKITFYLFCLFASF